MSALKFFHRFPRMHPRILVPVSSIVVLLVLNDTARSAENEAPPVPAPSVEQTNSNELLRSYLQLQEQLHGLKLSMEEQRKAADEAGARNASAMAERLQALEQTLAAERTRDLDAVRSSNNIMLTVSATFGVVGLLAMALMAYQWRTVSRLAEMAALPHPAVGQGSALAPLGAGDNRLLSGTAEQSNLRLLDAIGRLESRITQMEQAPATPLKLAAPNTDPAQALLPIAQAEPPTATATSTQNGGPVETLLGKGQSLLSLDQAEQALECFEQVLKINPSNTDALVKKAMALERLRKLDEAIECYDQAISADRSLTIAYLYKGGLYNRMERFGEALECYEQALMVQERK